MQWLINEFKDFKAEVHNKIDAAITSWATRQIQDAEKIQKLEGELKAMKARMGKKSE